MDQSQDIVLGKSPITKEKNFEVLIEAVEESFFIVESQSVDVVVEVEISEIGSEESHKGMHNSKEKNFEVLIEAIDETSRIIDSQSADVVGEEEISEDGSEESNKGMHNSKQRSLSSIFQAKRSWPHGEITERHNGSNAGS